MASGKTGTGILTLGGLAFTAILAVGWIFAASVSSNSERTAAEYAEESSDSRFDMAALATPDDAEPAEADAEQAEAESEPQEEAEQAEAAEETEQAEAPSEEERQAGEAEAAGEPEETETADAGQETEQAESAEAAGDEVEMAAAEGGDAAESEQAEAETTSDGSEQAAAESGDAAEGAQQAEASGEPSGDDAGEGEQVAAAGAGAVAGDAAAGAKVFNKCKACHVANEEKNRVGPHLVGVVGREVGAVADFKYSKAFKTASENGDVWTPENLAAFLEKPKDYYKGTKMAFAGLRKEDDRANVIAYLADPE